MTQINTYSFIYWITKANLHTKHKKIEDLQKSNVMPVVMATASLTT